MTPTLAGVHHELSVTDLDRSLRRYASRLGYPFAVEFHENGVPAGVVKTARMVVRSSGCASTPTRARAAA